MATFFDTTSTLDLALLHSSVRAHADLNNVVDNVEREVLLNYTTRTGENTYEVELEGYDDDVPADSHATLKEALRQAIGKIVSHRLRLYDAKSHFQSEKLGDYSYSRGTDSGTLDVEWPVGWDVELNRLYRERDVWYHV